MVYKERLTKGTYQLLDQFTKTEVTVQEQFELATNVFVIDPKTIIINAAHQRLIQILKDIGFNIIPIDFSQTAKYGDAFRCTTCPIERT